MKNKLFPVLTSTSVLLLGLFTFQSHKALAADVNSVMDNSVAIVQSVENLIPGMGESLVPIIPIEGLKPKEEIITRQLSEEKEETEPLVEKPKVEESIGEKGISKEPDNQTAKPNAVIMTKDKVLKTAVNYLGSPYRYGANSGSGYYDCSLFTQTVFKKHNIPLSRTSRGQFLQGKPVSFGNLSKGDLVFFSTKSRQYKSGVEKVGHVGIYSGNGKVIHTYNEDNGVTYSDITKGYWKKYYVGAKRVIQK